MRVVNDPAFITPGSSSPTPFTHHTLIPPLSNHPPPGNKTSNMEQVISSAGRLLLSTKHLHVAEAASHPHKKAITWNRLSEFRNARHACQQVFYVSLSIWIPKPAIYRAQQGPPALSCLQLLSLSHKEMYLLPLSLFGRTCALHTSSHIGDWGYVSYYLT